MKTKNDCLEWRKDEDHREGWDCVKGEGKEKDRVEWYVCMDIGIKPRLLNASETF